VSNIYSYRNYTIDAANMPVLIKRSDILVATTFNLEDARVQIDELRGKRTTAQQQRSRCKRCDTLGFIRERDPRTRRTRLFVVKRELIAGILSVGPDFERAHDQECRGTVAGDAASTTVSTVDREAARRELAAMVLELSRKTVQEEIAKGAAASDAAVKRVVEDAIKRVIAAMPQEPEAPPHITINVRDGEQREVEGERHPLFARLLRYVAGGSHVYLYGAPGGGKSTAARQAAEDLGRPFGYLSLAPMTPESRLVGFLDASGQYRSTPFYDCYTQGGVFCLDEMDNANDGVLTSINGALENGHAAFPCGIRERHKDFVMVATGNTAGYGGVRGHAGRRAFDAATRERFAYIPWTYDEGFEERLALAAHAEAGDWVRWVRAVRRHCAQHHPDVVVSPRASIRGAELLRDGAVETPSELAEAVLFKGLEEAQRTRILAAVPLPTVLETEARDAR